MSDQCCNSCGYLKCNFGKPNPPADKVNDKSQVDGTQWYSQENIDRLWDNTRDSGYFLTCHSTDHRYYAKDKKKLTACLGFTLCIYMHIKIYEVSAKANFKKYIKIVGDDVAMTQRGMFEAAFSMATGYADLFKQMRIPLNMSEDRKLTFPTGFEKTILEFKKIVPSFDLA